MELRVSSGLLPMALICIFHHEKCYVDKEKLSEQELSCYIFLNLGSYFVMLLLYVLLYVILLGLCYAFGTKKQ